jgi:hypothetical protein
MTANAFVADVRPGRTASTARPVLVVLGIVASLAVGWYLRSAVPHGAALVIVGEMSGSVALVNASGSKACIAPTGTAEQRCGVVYGRPDAPPLVIGREITVAIAQLRTPDGSVEVFIVEPGPRR